VSQTCKTIRYGSNIWIKEGPELSSLATDISGKEKNSLLIINTKTQEKMKQPLLVTATQANAEKFSLDSFSTNPLHQMRFLVNLQELNSIYICKQYKSSDITQ